MNSLKVQVRHLGDALEGITRSYLELKDHYESLVKVKKNLETEVETLETKVETLEDKISDLEADLHAMRHSRDVLMSWVKLITEEEYSWNAIRVSGLRVIKTSLEEEERPKLHRKGRL